MKLIILPGWQHSSDDWRAVSNELTARNVSHEVIDLPGFGSEAYDPKFNSLDSVVEWCGNALKNFGTEPIILCGHSYGGRIAVKLATKADLNLEKLILIGSPNLYRPDLKTKVKKAIVKLTKPLKLITPEALRSKFRSYDYETVRGTELEVLFKDIIKDDQTNLLQKITTQTQLIWGENDSSAPIWIAEEMNKLILNSNLEVIAGTGHNLHLEKPTLLAAKLAHYVKAN